MLRFSKIIVVVSEREDGHSLSKRMAGVAALLCYFLEKSRKAYHPHLHSCDNLLRSIEDRKLFQAYSVKEEIC